MYLFSKTCLCHDPAECKVWIGTVDKCLYVIDVVSREFNKKIERHTDSIVSLAISKKLKYHTCWKKLKMWRFDENLLF